MAGKRDDDMSFWADQQAAPGVPSSEAKVKRGDRAISGGRTELVEKLGGHDPCPCGSGRRFQPLLPSRRAI